MFSKLVIVFTATLVALVAAGDINNSCNTGPVQCCNEVYHSSSKKANDICELFGINAPVSGFVGTQCSPITGAGVGSGANCKSQPMCCTGNNYKGLVVVGCSPINVNL
ncbi:fungal hydrophobin [Crepidotus variabilis]|uniref:Hydrophobin n=1 Tax=Crepidotus variabilis TaxID=179855 RepID=A0A9P6JVW8_9AGAR|nr:fungal hydrophobin [Crepidotus variabilis]